MNIGVYVNELKDKNFVYTDRLIKIMQKKKIDFALFNNYKGTAINVCLLDLKSLVAFGDLVIVLGGDGTILQVIKECAKQNTPVVGINLGHLGFLADIEKNQLEQLFGLLENNAYHIEERSLVEAYYGGKEFLALNDIVISKGENTRLINIETHVGDMLLDNYFCDGLIVSTPTGSTAYSMSVGGPILAPDIAGLIINPISSHSLHSRPVVIADGSRVGLICTKLNIDCQLVVDGELVAKIKNNDKILIKKSKYKALLIRLDGNNFYSVLLKKLNRWGVTENKE